MVVDNGGSWGAAGAGVIVPSCWQLITHIESFPIRAAIESINARVRYDEADAHERLAHAHFVGQEAAATRVVDHLSRVL